MTTQADVNDPQPITSGDSTAEIVLRRSELLQRTQQFAQAMDRRVREIIDWLTTAPTPTADR